MTLRSVAGSLAVYMAPCMVLVAVSRPASAGDCTHCPKTVFCRPKPPCIKYKCVCPKPVCGPCDMEHFGYYPTCWQPWPFPPDYSHCPAVLPMMMPPPGMPTRSPVPSEILPNPQEVPSKLTLR